MARKSLGVAATLASHLITQGDVPTQVISFNVPGTLTVGAGTARWYAPWPCTIVNVSSSVGTQPTGASVISDLNKNGTTVFTTQGNRPTIAVSTNRDATAAPDVTTLAAGDYLTCDTDQIGSTVAGADLVVQVELRVD